MAGLPEYYLGGKFTALQAYKNDLPKYGGIAAGAGGMQEYPADVNRIWEEDYAGVVGEGADAGRTANQNILERELAKLRMRMGYNQSAGAGTGGRWDLARGNMLNAGAQQQMKIDDQWRQWEASQHLNFLNIKDQQQHQLTMGANQAYYQQEALKLQAELNDPTWWESFGSIVGMGLGIWGLAGFPSLFGTTTAAGGIVGGGVAGGWNAAGS